MFPVVGYILLFVAVGAAFILVNLLVGKLIRPVRPHQEKETIYECGEPTIGSAWVQFDLRFYIVALFYLVFDVEVALIYPWAVVFRDFPLRNIHPQAQKAAEAAQCAAEQKKFWPYHDKLFTAASLQIDDLKKYAHELELNVEQFAACLDSNKYVGGIDADMQAGQNAGVNATPTFFVNGYPLSGAASYERFKEVVDAALEQAQSAQRTN